VVTANNPLTLGSGGISFGSGISTTGNQFTNFVLQPGIYQIHLSGRGFVLPAPLLNLPPLISTQRNPVGPFSEAVWSLSVSSIFAGQFDIEGGDRLVSVLQPNTVLQFIPNDDISGVVDCRLVITKLQ
jgi:hypothetical protein